MTRSTGIVSWPPSAAVMAALVTVLGSGCDEQAAPAPRIEIDSAGVGIVNSDPLGSDAMCSLGDEPTFYIGDSEESEEQWFTRVLGVARLSDGSVAVADDYSSEVRIFDKTGSHVRSMGREGEGPGEFKNLWLMWRLPGDTLWVGDYRPQRYHVYASTGDWIRTVTMDPFYLNPSRAGGVLANGVSINARDERARRQDFSTPDKRHVEAHGPDGKLMGILASLPGRTFGQVDDGTLNYNLDPWFDASPSIDAEGRTIAIANGRDPEVRVLDDEMRLRLIIRWDGPGGKDYTIWEFGADYVLGVHETDLGVQHVAMYDLERPVAPPE